MRRGRRGEGVREARAGAGRETDQWERGEEGAEGRGWYGDSRAAGGEARREEEEEMEEEGEEMEEDVEEEEEVGRRR